jgi:hypothetical protein
MNAFEERKRKNAFILLASSYYRQRIRSRCQLCGSICATWPTETHFCKDCINEGRHKAHHGAAIVGAVQQMTVNTGRRMVTGIVLAPVLLALLLVVDPATRFFETYFSNNTTMWILFALFMGVPLLAVLVWTLKK